MNQTIRKRIKDINNGIVPEGYKQTPFGIFPCDWEAKSMNQICDIYSGGTPSTKKEEYWDGDIPWCCPTDITQSNKYIEKTERNISRQGLENSSAMLMPINSILMCSRATIGPRCINEVPMATNQGFKNLLCKNKNDTEFVYYLLEQLVANFLKTSSGSTFLELSKSELEKAEYYLSKSEVERNKIAEILMKWDEMVELQEQYIQKLELRKKAYIDKFFTEKSCNCVFKDLYVQAGEGGTPDTKKVEYYENGNIPFVKIEHLYKKYIEEIDSFITKEGLKKSGAWLVPENSLIFSNGATIGECSINRIPVTTKQGILGIVPSGRIELEYFYYLLKSEYFLNKVKKITTKGTMCTAYLKDIDKLKLYTHSKAEQSAISKLLGKVDEEISLQKEKLEKIKIQRKAMQQYLLTGIVRVS